MMIPKLLWSGLKKGRYRSHMVLTAGSVDVIVIEEIIIVVDPCHVNNIIVQVAIQTDRYIIVVILVRVPSNVKEAIPQRQGITATVVVVNVIVVVWHGEAGLGCGWVVVIIVMGIFLVFSFCDLMGELGERGRKEGNKQERIRKEKVSENGQDCFTIKTGL